MDTTAPKLTAAEEKRDDAEMELFISDILLSGKEDLIVAEQENRTVLIQQKSQLEALKNTKEQLQTLYTRVKTIIDQLKQHVSSHSAITQEIANLLTEAQTLEDEIIVLESWIASAE